MRHFFSGARVASIISLSVLLILTSLAWSKDLRFDVASMDCTPDGSDPHFCLSQFDALNWQTTNGHFLAMATDIYRTDILNQGNGPAAYYNSFDGLYQTYPDPATAAAHIQSYIQTNWSSGVPWWVVLNEISGSQWPNNSAYRSWVINTVADLHNTYNHAVIIFSPFKSPGNHASDWTSLSSHCRIAVESYLSGSQVNASGNQVSWCQSQYQSYVDHYHNLGVPYSQIFLTEHYGQTVSGTAWGRAGVSYAGWDNAIQTRAKAIHNIFVKGDIGGYISYGWGKNGMNVSEADMIHFENTYAGMTLP